MQFANFQGLLAPRVANFCFSQTCRRYGVLTKPATKHLAFDTFTPAEPGPNSPLVIVHGMFGSKNNWRSISRRLAANTGRTIFTLDMRNHGESPHSPVHTYDAMAADLRQFLHERELERFVLMGHSMGGKTVMAAALDGLQGIEDLIVVDMAPVAYDDQESITNIVTGLSAMDLATIQNRGDAEAFLLANIPNVDMETVKFLTSNLLSSPGGRFSWRFNLDAIGRATDTLRDFPKFDEPYMGRTLFIYGTRSDYLTLRDFRATQRLFPRAEYVAVDCGHWVHYEAPAVFLDNVTRVLNARPVPLDIEQAL